MWWAKYKHKFSHDHDEEWSWEFIDNEFPSKELAENYVKEELAPRWVEQFSYSEHYRGVDFEIETDAPLEVIKQQRDIARGRAQSWHARAATFNTMLDKFRSKCPTCRCRLLPGEECRCCLGIDIKVPGIDD